MARQARALSPTNCYHVMMRGNNKEDVFYNDDLKNRFIKMMTKVIEECSAELLAWCLMDNHVHIVLRSEGSIGQIFKSINVSYAMQYNVAHKRVGHVFQDRFRSEVIVDEKHLLAVIRYVHRNPQKAGLVKKLEDYAYSSYSLILIPKSDKDLPLQSAVIGLFSDSLEAFIDFHNEEDDREYLEMPEEIKKQRLDQAYRIIEAYYREQDAKTVTDELILNLISQSKLSHRKMAEVLSISASRVDKVGKERFFE